MRSDDDSDLRFGQDGHLVGRRGGKGLSVFDHDIDNHAHHILDVAEGFFAGVAPGGGARRHLRRAVGMPAVAVGLDNHFEIVGHGGSSFCQYDAKRPGARPKRTPGEAKWSRCRRPLTHEDVDYVCGSVRRFYGK